MSAVNLDQATTLLTNLAHDAARWRIETAQEGSVRDIPEQTGAELYAALSAILALPPAPPGRDPAPRLSSSPRQ